MPADLDIVILRPPHSQDIPETARQFTKRFRIRRAVVLIWLQFLQEHHPGYSDIILSRANLSELPEDGSIFNQLTIREFEDAANIQDGGAGDGNTEEAIWRKMRITMRLLCLIFLFKNLRWHSSEGDLLLLPRSCLPNSLHFSSASPTLLITYPCPRFDIRLSMSLIAHSDYCPWRAPHCFLGVWLTSYVHGLEKYPIRITLSTP